MMMMNGCAQEEEVRSFTVNEFVAKRHDFPNAK